MSTSPALVHAVEAILLSRVGREQAIRGCEVMAILHAAGHPAHLRRVSEAVAELRAKGLPVLATSSRGYYLAATEDERAEAASELRKRIAALNRSLYHLDAACAGRVQLALGFGGVA
jgi:hypothetical protein